MPAIGLDELIGDVDRRRPASTLDGLVEAEQLAAELQAIGDRLIGHYVELVRAEGWSWADIGEHVGVTRQAAQQRYGARWATLSLSDLERAGALDRLTARAREALIRAEHHARRLGHDAVTTDHLVLAIVEDRATLASKALRRSGVDLVALRRRVERSLAPAADAPPAVIPVAASARRCLARAVDEALSLGHNYIGTEHLVLGATADVELGADLDVLRAAVVAQLDDYLRTRE